MNLKATSEMWSWDDKVITLTLQTCHLPQKNNPPHPPSNQQHKTNKDINQNKRENKTKQPNKQNQNPNKPNPTKTTETKNLETWNILFSDVRGEEEAL